MVPETKKKANECRNQAKQYNLNFAQSRTELGIQGHDIEAELRGLAAGLPAVYQQLDTLLHAEDLDTAVAFYGAFVEYAHGGGSGMLPWLRQAREHGVAGSAAGSSGGQAAAVKIDWDVGGGEEGADIDWGITSGDTHQQPACAPRLLHLPGSARMGAGPRKS